MRETHNVDTCDNEECEKVLMDERNDVYVPYIFMTMNNEQWGCANEQGRRVSLNRETKNLIFCDEECLFTYVKKHYAKIKMAAIKQ